MRKAKVKHLDSICPGYYCQYRFDCPRSRYSFLRKNIVVNRKGVVSLIDFEFASVDNHPSWAGQRMCYRGHQTSTNDEYYSALKAGFLLSYDSLKRIPLCSDHDHYTTGHDMEHDPRPFASDNKLQVDKPVVSTDWLDGEFSRISTVNHDSADDIHISGEDQEKRELSTLLWKEREKIERLKQRDLQKHRERVKGLLRARTQEEDDNHRKHVDEFIRREERKLNEEFKLEMMGKEPQYQLMLKKKEKEFWKSKEEDYKVLGIVGAHRVQHLKTRLQELGDEDVGTLALRKERDSVADEILREEGYLESSEPQPQVSDYAIPTQKSTDGSLSLPYDIAKFTSGSSWGSMFRQPKPEERSRVYKRVNGKLVEIESGKNGKDD